jgi:hypothetical protein
MNDEYTDYMGYVTEMLGRNGTSSYMTYRGDTYRSYVEEPDMITDGRIKIPDTFRDVVLKLCPEVSDVTTFGYTVITSTYDRDLNQVKRYLVSVDIHFSDNNYRIKNKEEYKELLNDYFKMTYADMDFITIGVNSFKFPPVKTNEDKFFELFGK